MFLDRIKLISQERASRLLGIDSQTIAQAMQTFRATNGERGLAFIIPPGKKRPLIRLCAIDKWITEQEDVSRYA